MPKYIGTLIEESITDKNILGALNIIEKNYQYRLDSTKEKFFSLFTFEVEESIVDILGFRLSESLNKGTDYIEMSNTEYTYVIFKNKVYKIPYGDNNGMKEIRMFAEKIKGISFDNIKIDRFKYEN